MARVIGAELECHCMRILKDVPAGHGMLATLDGLVDARCMLNDAAAGCADDEVAGIIECDFARTLNVQLDVRRIGLRADLEIIFQSALFAAINEVHARIDIAQAHAAERWNIGAPFFGSRPMK